MCYVEIFFVPSQSVLASWSGCVTIPSGVGKSSDVLGPPFVPELSRSFNILQIKKYKTNHSTDLDQMYNFSSHVFPQLVKQYVTEKRNMFFLISVLETFWLAFKVSQLLAPRELFKSTSNYVLSVTPCGVTGHDLHSSQESSVVYFFYLRDSTLLSSQFGKPTIQTLLAIYHFIQKLLTHINMVSLTGYNKYFKSNKINEH